MRNLMGLLAGVLVVSIATPGLSQEKTQQTERVKAATAVVEQFVDAAVRGDAQRVLAVAEVPFLMILNPRNYKVFTKREDLQRIFSRKIRKFGTPDNVRVPQVAFVLTIKETRKRYANRLPAPLLAELEKLFADDDLALFVRGRTRDGRLIGKWIAFVRFRNGKPKLGGFSD